MQFCDGECLFSQPSVCISFFSADNPFLCCWFLFLWYLTKYVVDIQFQKFFLMTLSQFCQSFPHTWFAAYYQYVYFHSFMHVCIFHLPYFLPLIGLSIPFLFTFFAFPPSVCLFLRVPRVHQAAPGRLTTAAWPQLEHENTPSLLPLPPPRLPPHWYHSNHTDTSNTTLIPSRWYHQHYSSHCLFYEYVDMSCANTLIPMHHYRHAATNAPLPPAATNTLVRPH